MTANTKIYAPHKPQTMKNLNDLTANDAIRVDSAEQWNQLAPMLDRSKWIKFDIEKFVNIKFYKPFYLRGFDRLGVTYTISAASYNIIPASEFLTDKNNEPMKEKPMSNEMPSDEWIRTKAESLALEPSASPSDWDYIAKYIRIGMKEMRSEAEKALAYERWKAQMFDKWKSMNRWKYNSGNDGYDHFDVFALNYREHKTFDELYNSEEYAQYLQTLKQPTQ